MLKWLSYYPIISLTLRWMPFGSPDCNIKHREDDNWVFCSQLGWEYYYRMRWETFHHKDACSSIRDSEQPPFYFFFLIIGKKYQIKRELFSHSFISIIGFVLNEILKSPKPFKIWSFFFILFISFLLPNNFSLSSSPTRNLRGKLWTFIY